MSLQSLLAKSKHELSSVELIHGKLELNFAKSLCSMLCWRADKRCLGTQAFWSIHIVFECFRWLDLSGEGLWKATERRPFPYSYGTSKRQKYQLVNGSHVLTINKPSKQLHGQVGRKICTSLVQPQSYESWQDKRNNDNKPAVLAISSNRAMPSRQRKSTEADWLA